MSPGARPSHPFATSRTIGVIDIGTNSVKLAVGMVKRGRVRYRHTARIPTRLGRGLSASGTLDAASIRRTAAAVARLATDARGLGAVDTVAVGTYALRSARNGCAAAREIERRSGVRVRILSGAEESRMVLRSVRARLPRSYRNLMVIDIGGGSAELVFARGARDVTARSVPLGAVRLTELFLTADPIAIAEYTRMNDHITAIVGKLLAGANTRAYHMTVSGGTATTAASMLGCHADGYGCAVRRATLHALEQRCLNASIAQRRRFKGLAPDRADIIPAGLAVLIEFVRQADKRWVRLIDGGVRDGVMPETAERARRSPRRNTTTVRERTAVRKGR